MMLSIIWAVFIAASFLFSLSNNSINSTASAINEGAAEAVRFLISIGGPICFWSAFMEMLAECRLTEKLSRLLSPFLKRLFPISYKNKKVYEPLCENVSANLLGLGNAATPKGIETAKKMSQLGKAAEGELYLFVVLNTAAVQLLPTTAAAIRSACGASSPFDITAAVWICSLLSLSAGVIASKMMQWCFYDG